MPPVVYQDKCRGCGRCEDVCPGDLMELNEEKKAVCRSKRDCWDCMACVKACQYQALETRIPYQLGYYPARLIPKVSEKEIEWTCIDMNGKLDKFLVKTRNN